MIIAGIYSFNNGEDSIRSQHLAELKEVEEVIASVDSTQCKTKTSQEKQCLVEIYTALEH